MLFVLCFTLGLSHNKSVPLFVSVRQHIPLHYKVRTGEGGDGCLARDKGWGGGGGGGGDGGGWVGGGNEDGGVKCRCSVTAALKTLLAAEQHSNEK